MPQSTIALMLESEGPGGAEVVVLHLADELRRRGHEVVPAVLTREADGWLERQYRERGFVPERIGIRGAIDLRTLRSIMEMLKRRRATAVHSHEFGMAVYGSAAASWLGLPHVITLHGNMWMTNAWRRREALRWASRRSITTAVSENTRQHLLRTLEVPATRIRTVLNGVPEQAGDRRQLRRELALADDEVLIVAVGNLIERKGHAHLIDALAQVTRAAPEARWHLAIAGDGLERPRLEQLIAERRLGGRVHLLGHRRDIADVLAASDIFCMPSIWEGLPLAVLEAMFAGVPVVASGISGIPEAVTSGREGILVPPGEVPPLADALRRLVLDHSLRQRMGVAAQVRARAEFGVGIMSAQYEAFYGGRAE